MKPVPKEFRALTVTASGILRVLKTDCRACAAFDPLTIPASSHPPLEHFTTIWDTGATNSVITQGVVDKCGLKPTGMKQVHGVHSTQDAETFLINVMLPNGVGVVNLEVTLGQIHGADLLLGMDIITGGDFSITNGEGRTIFSFRVPSIATIDYVKEANRNVAMFGKGKPKFKPSPPKHKRKR